MAPKVRVPADFGIRHIGAPSNGDISFNMKEGDPIKAISVILSLNSPVIENLTKNLFQTSLDADDFSREAVDCFIEASYSREIDAVTLENFRDVSKMINVFNVSWLSDRCVGYFDDYLKKLDTESSHTDLVFAVDEAVYQLSTIRKRVLLDLVVQKFSQLSVEYLDKFFKEYLRDFGASTSCVIDCCIAIAQSNIHIILEIFIEHLEKKELKVLDDNSRVLLKKADLSLCFLKKPELRKRFSTVLDQITPVDQDDVTLILSWLKQAKKKKKKKKKKKACAPKKAATPVNVSVCLLSLRPYLDMDYDEAIESLLNNKCITNLYMLFDAIWIWFFRKGNDFTATNLLEKIISKQKQEKWTKMIAEYFLYLYDDVEGGGNKIRNLMHMGGFKQLVDTNLMCDLKITVVCELLRDKFVEEVFTKNTIFRFKLPNTSPTDQEFELIVTASGDGNPDKYSIEWRRLSDKPAETEETPLPTLHFAVRLAGKASLRERWYYHWKLFPISWCGKPTCDKTMKHWNWGYINFYETDAIKDKKILARGGYVNWKHKLYALDRHCPVQLVCLQVD